MTANLTYMRPMGAWWRRNAEEGRASVVTVRGQNAERDGKFCGTLGRGQFLQRKPSHV